MDTLYLIASDGIAKRKVIQVALRTMFRLKKDKPEKTYGMQKPTCLLIQVIYSRGGKLEGYL
ncbi:MAG: hypothetical protein QXF82_05400 [Nitrososphaeria archaeon]